VSFVADDLGAWLIGALADAIRKRLTTLVLGSDQERGLRSAATAAVELTAAELRPEGGQRAEALAMLISQVFTRPMPKRLLSGQATLLEALQTGIARQLAALDDRNSAGGRKSSAEMLGFSTSMIAEKLTTNLVREIIIRGTRGGPLTPLAAQLNHDVTHLQGKRLEGMLGQLANEVRIALAQIANERKGSDNSDKLHEQIPSGHKSEQGLVSQGGNKPVQQYSMASNAIAHKASPVRTDRVRAARVLDDALRAAQSISDPVSKASELVNIALVLAAIDQHRAARLIADAERIAQSVAQRNTRASALAGLAGALAARDPNRAARLITDAERIVESRPDRGSMITGSKAELLQLLVESLDYKAGRDSALADIAQARAVIDPNGAPHGIWRIDDQRIKASALAHVARALAANHPDRAARIAQSITDEDLKGLALAGVAAGLAAADPDRAERIAQSITNETCRVVALADSAKGALAASDPDRAARLTTEAEGAAQSINDESFRAAALASVVGAMAATDPDRAERIALSITDDTLREVALTNFAVNVAANNPDRAEIMAQSISGGLAKAAVLVRVAQAWIHGSKGAASRSWRLRRNHR
jgi:hypothetical protein